jgi:hypothetical protein
VMPPIMMINQCMPGTKPLRFMLDKPVNPLVRQKLENFNSPLQTRDVRTSRRARTDFLVARR